MPARSRLTSSSAPPGDHIRPADYELVVRVTDGAMTLAREDAMITSDAMALAGPAGNASYGDDDFAPGATFLDVPDGRRGLAERVGLVDGGCDLPGLDEIPEDSQVSGVLRSDEPAEFLAHQRGEQVCPEQAVGAVEPPAPGFASDDDEPAAGGEGTTKV